MSTHLNNVATITKLNNVVGSSILIFKTNLLSKNDLSKIETVLNQLPEILDWNVDLDDIDKVLRIESRLPESGEIVTAIQAEGYFCEELPD